MLKQYLYYTNDLLARAIAVSLNWIHSRKNEIFLNKNSAA